MKRIEIGSFFFENPILADSNIVFPENTQWFISGRNALQMIISSYLGRKKTASIPSWCCESIIKPFLDLGIKVNFYPVYYRDNRLIQEVDYNSDITLVMDFFGFSDNPIHSDGYKGLIIRDLTHSLFSKNYNDADFYYGSLRKWCAVKTGGFAFSSKYKVSNSAYKTNTLYVSKRTEAMLLKEKYMKGLSESKEYLNLFSDTEKMLESTEYYYADKADVESAKRIDVDFIKRRRKNNAKLLMNAFPEWVLFKTIKDDDVPLFVPVIIPDGKRDELKEFLIKNEIYCPVHWPESCYHKLDKQERFLYLNELSLICDQRYSENDIQREISTINMFLKG